MAKDLTYALQEGAKHSIDLAPLLQPLKSSRKRWPMDMARRISPQWLSRSEKVATCSVIPFTFCRCIVAAVYDRRSPEKNDNRRS